MCPLCEEVKRSQLPKMLQNLKRAETVSVGLIDLLETFEGACWILCMYVFKKQVLQAEIPMAGHYVNTMCILYVCLFNRHGCKAGFSRLVRVQIMYAKFIVVQSWNDQSVVSTEIWVIL